MKRFLKTLPILLLILFALSSCTQSAGIEIFSSELYSNQDSVTAKFEIINNEKEKIEDLNITVESYDKNGTLLSEVTVGYTMYVDPQAIATLGVAVDAQCQKAVAVSYEYVIDGKTKTGEFKTAAEATTASVTTKDTKYETREELAQDLIEDIKRQFMLQKYEAHGYYDSENKSLVIAAYTTKSYSDCAYENSIDPSAYSTLAQAISAMSQTCYDEFKRCGFSDVQSSVGLLSADEKIMISATNGMIVENFN